ncbi:MAG: 50S ribosomal protein L18 [Thermodesulfobacteriota bacterium]
MDAAIKRRLTRLKKQQRVRRKITGTAERPRLCVFRSSRHMYAQLIDDVAGHTLAAASTCEKKLVSGQTFENKTGAASYIGKMIAERAKEKGISSVVFDRNGYLYHGRVKAVSDGAREGGLVF